MSLAGVLLYRRAHHDYDICTQVSPECPVSGTTYGYYPILSINSLFCAVFFLCFIAQCWLGFRYRTWPYLVAVGLGTFGEALGYVARLMLRHNPWNKTGFEIAICCLVLSPSFLAAGIYLILRNLVIYSGPQYSKLKPALYTWLFIGCDIGSIFVQAIGGGVAAAAGDQNSQVLLSAGDDLIVAGITLQAVTMFACAMFAGDFYLRLRRRQRQNPSEKRAEDEHSKGVRTLTYSTIAAFVFIFIRCIYRIPEMAYGWGNPLMQNETEFLILDGMMIGIAAVLLTVVHPGWTFPSMRKPGRKRRAVAESEQSE